MFQQYIGIHGIYCTNFGFKNNRPSLSWVDGFLKRRRLTYQSIRGIDDTRTDAVALKNCAEHLSRVSSLISQYDICDTSRIFNLDQTGSSSHRMVGRSLRKGIGKIGSKILRRSVRTRGALKRVTGMPVISTAGHSYKPIIVYPGKQIHYRKVKGVVQTIQSFHPPCYFHQRSIPGVDTSIMYNWAKNFVSEKSNFVK